MKLRKLKKFKQEQLGWGDTVKICSSFGPSNFWCENGKYDGSKFVHPAMYISSGRRYTWRPL